MSEVIYRFLHEEKNARAIHAVLEKGMKLDAPRDRDGAPLQGKKFVFTGGMAAMSRSEAKRLVESAGGKAVSSVSAETDYVVAGEAAGSKLARATELGLEILDEKGFLAMMRDLGIGLPPGKGNGN